MPPPTLSDRHHQTRPLLAPPRRAAEDSRARLEGAHAVEDLADPDSASARSVAKELAKARRAEEEAREAFEAARSRAAAAAFERRSAAQQSARVAEGAHRLVSSAAHSLSATRAAMEEAAARCEALWNGGGVGGGGEGNTGAGAHGAGGAGTDPPWRELAARLGSVERQYADALGVLEKAYPGLSGQRGAGWENVRCSFVGLLGG